MATLTPGSVLKPFVLQNLKRYESINQSYSHTYGNLGRIWGQTLMLEIVSVYEQM